MFVQLVALLMLGSSEESQRYEHENPEFSLMLPSAEWRKFDQSTHDVVVLIFSPDTQMATRCSVLVLPESAMPGGLAGREEQIAKSAGAAYSKVAFEEVTAFDRAVTRWEYRVAGSTTVEWGFVDDGRNVVFQLAAPDAAWADTKSRARLDAVFDSFAWKGGEVVVKKVLVDLTPTADVRQMRRKNAEAAATRAVELASHRIVARVEPAEHSFTLTDTITLIGVAESTPRFDLYYSVIGITEVLGARLAKWSTSKGQNSDVLHLEFDPPLLRGEKIELTVKAEAADFVLETDQQLIAEIGVLGQVRKDSSWSSHVVWYPTDAWNDAAVDITFDVPESHRAITGGKLEAETVADGRRRARFVEDFRIRRILPFGFAVGEYESRTARSDGGLEMEVFGFVGEAKLIEQRVGALETGARIFERALGPLPWGQVRFVHVRPIRLETGVSLPGMILVSDQYFPDLDGVDLSDGDLGNPKSLGLLVVADELSHQWNIYAAGLPNELGEGISTYTNALFVEELHGAPAYRKTIATCRRAWIGSAGRETEYAVANPLVYTNTRYRAVVFCKTPIVLDHLRRRLGDDRFFAGFRRGFMNRDTGLDGFDRLAKGFTDETGVDHGPFFEQWFFRAGFPTIAVKHESTENGLRVTIEQTQDEPAYELDVELAITLDDGRVVNETVTSRVQRESFEFAVQGKVVSVAVANRDVIPAKIEK